MDQSTTSSPEGNTEAGDYGNQKKMKFSAPAEILACSWCKNDLTIPVFQKMLGISELVCSDCFYNKDQPGRRSLRAICRSSSDYFRNDAIEKILHAVSVSCKNATLGCTTLCSFLSRRKHEKEDCEYVEAFKRPWSGCNEVCEKAEAEGEHLTSTHNVEYCVNADEGSFELSLGDERVLVKFESDNLFLVLHHEMVPLGQQLYLTSLQEYHSSARYELEVWIDSEWEESYIYKPTSRPTAFLPKEVVREVSNDPDTTRETLLIP